MVSSSVLINSTPSGVVNLEPSEVCYLSGTPLSCNITVTGVGIGNTKITVGAPGQPLMIKVTN